MITSDKHSVWISARPWAEDGSHETSFFDVGALVGWEYNLKYSGSSTGILGQGPDNAIYMDSTGGAVGTFNITGVRSVYKDDANEKYSNAEVAEMLEHMHNRIQMQNNAYILRIYNMSATGAEAYHDFYVFLQRFEITYSMSRPVEMEIRLELIQRNRRLGFND